MKPDFCIKLNPIGVEAQLYGSATNQPHGLLSVSKNASCLAIVLGRIYYQHEFRLESNISISKDEIGLCTPASIALAIYLQHGWKRLSQMEGDFAFVIWDSKSHTIYAGRDPMGGYPLFWINQNGHASFASCFLPLLEQLPTRRLNDEYIADLLTAHGPINERNVEFCAFESIKRVRAGTIVRYEQNTGHTEEWNYWSWMARIKPPASFQLGELAESFAQLLRNAVRERCMGTVASHLSGGMDSTTVALIARDHIQTQSAAAKLHAISVIYKQLNALAREAPYIEAAWQQPGLIIHQVIGDNLLDFDIFHNPPLHDEPYAGLWRFAMDQGTILAAADAGASTLLTGLGADELLDWHPFHL